MRPRRRDRHKHSGPGRFRHHRYKLQRFRWHLRAETMYLEGSSYKRALGP